MDNLHFSDEFLNFPVQMNADIYTDALGFSARFCCDFLHDSARKNLGRNFVQIRAVNGETQQVCMYSNTPPSKAVSNDLKREMLTCTFAEELAT